MLSILAAVAAPAASVSLMYSGHHGGLNNTMGTFEEIRPFFEARYAAEVHADGMHAMPVLRRGPAMLLDPAGKATLAELDAELGRGELKPTGPAQAHEGLISDYAYLVQLDAHPWMARWMYERNRETGDYPDEHPGTLWVRSCANARGEARLLLSTTEAAAPLDHPEAWEAGMGSRIGASRGARHSELLGVVRMVPGSMRRVPLMERMGREAGSPVIAVDLGNAIANAGATRGRSSLDQDLALLTRLHERALVPDVNELARPLAEIRRIQGVVPLLAANLTADASTGVTFQKHLIVEAGGARIGLVGIVNDRSLAEDGLLGVNSPWQVTDPVKAATEAVAALQDEQLDAIAVLTNVSDERLVELRDLPHCTLLVASPYTSSFTTSQRETIELAHGDTMRPEHAPAMLVGAGHLQVGMSTLDFVKAGDRLSLARVRHRFERPTDQDPADPELAKQTRAFDLLENRSFTAAILPDYRQLMDPGPHSLDDIGYRAEHVGRLAGALVRQAAGAEVGVLPMPSLGSNLVGDVPLDFFEQWLPDKEKLVTVALTGKDLAKLAGLAGKHQELMVFAGYEADKAMIGGRALDPDATYRVATTDGLMRNRWLAEVFKDRPAEAKQAAELRPYVIGALNTRMGQSGGMTPNYVEKVRALVGDTGETLDPLLTVRVEDLNFNLANATASNATPFAQVRNTAINTPSNMAWGGKGKLHVVYDTAQTDWDNLAAVGYNRIVLQAGGTSVTNVTQDAVDYTSEFRLKFITLKAAGDAMSLVPYVNVGYETQFEPTVDQTTGQPNALERVGTGSGGVVLYPK